MMEKDDKSLNRYFPRIMFAAPKSGSGKTLITCAFLESLKRRGLKLQAFKCGPDYIDPMFHKKVLGIPSVNLDTWFTGREDTRRLFECHMKESGAEIGVIEGVMGLYDGLGGITEEASSYDLASVLDAPIILVIDANGMGLSLIAEIKGFQSMDRNHRIAGILLNKTTSSFVSLIRPEIEKNCGIPVVGCFPKQKDLQIESRHLGLKMPDEIAGLRKEVEEAADVLEKNVDIGRILSIANAGQGQVHFGNGGTLADNKNDNSSNYLTKAAENQYGKETSAEDGIVYGQNMAGLKSEYHHSRVRIAVAHDEAFCFYYEDNLKLLEELGAEIVLFSPIHDKKLPDDICGLYLGGGYPELKAEELSSNQSMRSSIAEAIRNGMPSIAECGGFMYLHQHMESMMKPSQDGRIEINNQDRNRNSDRNDIKETGLNIGNNLYPMVGAVPGKCFYTGKLVRFGYCSVQEHKSVFLPEGKTIRGHEFHYYDSDDNGSDCSAEKPVSGRKWECVHETENSWWGYPHLYWLSAPEYAEHFVTECRKFLDR